LATKSASTTDTIGVPLTPDAAATAVWRTPVIATCRLRPLALIRCMRATCSRRQLHRGLSSLAVSLPDGEVHPRMLTTP
jgi:hypothetical protein